jgi:catechol 2,3-dioxygenase-like lactoylglutathione lyase family enzyme
VSSVKFSGSVYIGVRDLDAALAWYQQKLDLKKSDEPPDEEVGDAVLVSKDLEAEIALGAPNPANRDTPMFAVSDAQKAWSWMHDRGLNVSPVQKDRQGTLFFELRDLEGNLIEFCEEP